MRPTIILWIALMFQTLNGQNRVQIIDSILTNFHQSGKFDGNVLLADKGKVIYSKSFGYANEATKAKLNENSVFEIASITKQFTAMGIVLLKGKGRLDYDDKIDKYIPELSNYNNISIRNLLSHTSGLPEYLMHLDTLLFDKLNWEQSHKIATNENIVQIFGKHQPRILFEPNQKFSYSNTGFALLALIIERISGKPYSKFLQDEIFKPLKMKNTRVMRKFYEPKVIKNMAMGYFFSDSLKRNMMFSEDKTDKFYRLLYLVDGVVGDEEIITSVPDLLKWDRALYSDKLVSAERKKEIFSVTELNDGKKTRYGFGWFVDNNLLYGKIVSHGGGSPGYRSHFERHIDHDKTLIILLNHTSKNTNIPIKELRQALHNIPPPIFIELKKEDIEKIVGSYELKDGTKVLVYSENGSIFREIKGEAKNEIKAITSTKFLMPGFSQDIFFEFIIKDGKAEKYIRTQPENGTVTEGIRIN